MSKVFLKVIGILLCFVVIAGVAILSINGVYDIPDKIILSENEQRIFNIGLPLDVKLKEDNVGVLRINGKRLNDNENINLSKPLVLSASEEGDAVLTVNILGFALKELTVSQKQGRYLIPGGESIGVTLFTKGALVVGTGEIVNPNGETVNPAREGGLLPGDIIERLNGTVIENADHLSSLIGKNNASGVTLNIKREAKDMTIVIKPVLDSADNVYRIGVWARDSTAGVGTLTYYDEKNNTFAGLGHAVTDLDTNKLLPIKNGEIIQSQIMEIDKGLSGMPGELHGSFSFVNNKLGAIKINTEFGIYGNIYTNANKRLSKEALLVAVQEEVEIGPAKIFSTIDQKGVREFDCEIIKINPQSFPAGKGMIIRITDTELLKRTGGIVQGMSGSPIIQNGKIVGAVTHVFLNSPDKGYGMFIEWMLLNSDKI